MTYFETLGIPASEIRLSVTDYVVASPEVTIFGVGFSITIAVLLWPGVLEGLSLIGRPLRILLGSVFLIGAFCIPTFALIYASRQTDPDSVLLTAQMLFSFVFISFGGMIIGSVVSADPPKNEQEFVSRKQEFALRKVISPLLVIVVMIVTVLVTSKYSSIIGEVDAMDAWATAPQAYVEWAVADTHDIGSNECDSDSLPCRFGVVLISDRYVYLRALNIEPPKERLFAVPIGGIGSIAYLFQGNAQ